MYCRAPSAFLPLAAFALVTFSACTRQPVAPHPQRLAILRFENLGGDVSTDWMGRAFSEIVTAELAGAPDIYVLPANRMHALDSSLGSRPVAAPGVSAERTLALVAGAHRIGYGEYAARHGRLEARLTIEDPRTGRLAQVISASASAGDVLAAASDLARQISSRRASYGTRNLAALKPYITGIESPESSSALFQQAIAADPDFAPPYRQLALLKARQQDRAGALDLLAQALARGGIPAVERARIELEAANLRNDAAARERALVALVKLDPEDTDAWRTLGGFAMNRHEYSQSVQAYQKALAAEPEDAGDWNSLAYAAA